ncbi:hypothetical protein KGM_202382 [Danaus plexippus plexippus]|uniref:Vesicle transport protein n=1 Tax=Danaus plexippus plexippus TaxID=278856 RepID=A0A212F4B4_DANPL|nr:hypothetical protein KGM_202382 [Danaus plexippus plexippus]
MSLRQCVYAVERLSILFDLRKIETRPQRKDYNQLSSNEKLDNRQIEDIHIEEADVDSDASSTDLDERDTRGVCPPCAHDRYNNNIRRHTHEEYSDDTDYAMATLKSDLDEYLLQNENRRSYKISLPFSTPSFFSRSNDETPTSTSTTSTWFENVQKEYFTLSRTQRFMGFGICLFFGFLCFILSFLYIPVLLLQARKFALLFSLGSLFFILSFSFLYGPWSHLKSLFTKERALTTSLYGFTLFYDTLLCIAFTKYTTDCDLCSRPSVSVDVDDARLYPWRLVGDEILWKHV